MRIKKSGAKQVTNQSASQEWDHDPVQSEVKDQTLIKTLKIRLDRYNKTPDGRTK